MLHVDAASGTTYPTLGTASGVLGLSINELHGMYLGADGTSGNGWIQAMREDGTGTAYDLVLQPSGGNVGIGTAAPSYKLDVRDGIVFAGRAVSDDGNISYTNTAAVFSSRGVDHDAARSNVLRLMRDGTSGVQYAGLADFDLESWESSGVLSRTAMTLKLGHGNLPDTTDVMTWRSNGNVGIGTTSPSATLHLNKTNATSTNVGYDGAELLLTERGGIQI